MHNSIRVIKLIIIYQRKRETEKKIKVDRFDYFHEVYVGVRVDVRREGDREKNKGR